MASIGGLSTPVNTGISVPANATIDIAVANVEQLYNFPINTKQFRIFNDGKYVLKTAYLATETSTNYYPVYPGAELLNYNIVAPNVTIYLQSPGLITLRLEIWT